MKSYFKTSNCPACIFGCWEITFGQYKGKIIPDTPLEYQKWLIRNGYAFLTLQELWHHNGHKPEEHPDAVLQRLTSG